MQRCIDLARKGAGLVSPNPMVGAVLVHNDRIIGEGWHQQYGGAHAEVNCINAVAEQDRQLIGQSTMYVSLEPCAHYGKTPPCADLIIKHQIPHVVMGCIDTFSEVAGRGISKLEAAGIKVTTGIMEQECRWLNKRFFTRQEQGRPYLILKWAESEDGFIAPDQGKRVMLSNTYSQTLVHKMRSEEDAILVGYQTALLDDPTLNNRYGKGKQPLRIIIDPELKLPGTLKIFDRQHSTLILNDHRDAETEGIIFKKTAAAKNRAEAIAAALPSHINSVIIEGGRKTLQMFIDAGLWDEAVVFGTKHILQSGTKAPVLKDYSLLQQFNLSQDSIKIYHHEYSRTLPGQQ